MIIISIPNILFLALQLVREQDEMHMWSSKLSQEGVWSSSLNPAISNIYFGKAFSGILVGYSDDYKTWELSSLDIESGDIQQRSFNTIKITGNIDSAKFYLLPSETEINKFLVDSQLEGGEDFFFTPDARDNATLLLRKELTFEEFDALSKLGRFVSIEGVSEMNDDLGADEEFSFISISLSNK